MPGIPSHMLLMDEAAKGFSPGTDSELFAILNLHPDFARLGATGPDMTFFAPDFGEWSVELVEVITEFYDDVIAPIVGLYEDWVEPVVDVLSDIKEGVEAVLDEVTCDLVGTFSDNLDLVLDRVGAIGQSLILTAFSKAVNIFDEMTSPIQKGKSEEDWYWFDYLHNRRTGQFIREMWSRADTDPKRAYVLGYTSHYASDFVGHQYVNAVVGGPARSHLARHHFAENMIDVRLYDELLGAELTGAALHRRLPHGNEIDELGTLRAVLDQPNDIPDDMRPIFQMMNDAMQATYHDTAHPKRIDSEYLTVENLNTSFWFMLATLKSTTSSFLPPPSFPGAEVLDAVNDAISEFIETVASPPTPPGSAPDVCFSFWSSSCDFSLDALEEWAEYLWDTVTYLGDLLAWIGELIKDLWQVFACTMTGPIKLALHGAFWLAHKALHELLTYLRECLVLAAFIHPERDWLNNSPLAQSLLTVGQLPLVDAREERYPHRAAVSNEGFHAYPATPTENPPTTNAPFDAGMTPLDIMFTSPTNDPLRDAYADVNEPEDTRTIEFQRLGESVDAAIPMMTRLMRELVGGDESNFEDWTMDADRGMGYKNWRLLGSDVENTLAWDSVEPVEDELAN